MAVVNTKVPLFKDPLWHFQIKMKFRKKITRQGSVRLPDADLFWIIPCIEGGSGGGGALEGDCLKREVQTVCRFKEVGEGRFGGVSERD